MLPNRDTATAPRFIGQYSHSAPPAETGWSHLNNPGRKAVHDFRNLIQDLMYAVEIGDRDLICGYANLLEQSYLEARKRS